MFIVQHFLIRKKYLRKYIYPNLRWLYTQQRQEAVCRSYQSLFTGDARMEEPNHHRNIITVSRLCPLTCTARDTYSLECSALPSSAWGRSLYSRECIFKKHIPTIWWVEQSRGYLWLTKLRVIPEDLCTLDKVLFCWDHVSSEKYWLLLTDLLDSTEILYFS